MQYYNIHTHTISTNVESAECNSKYILNIYPHDFETKKNEITSCGKFSCGIHPWYLEDYESAFALLKEIVDDYQVVAIGEVGLDKVCGTDFSDQIKVFSWQIELAINVNKPLIVHCVKAWDEYVDYSWI